MENIVLKFTPDLWETILGVRIIDADGWRTPDSPSWSTMITREDFISRMRISTVEVTDPERYSQTWTS